MCTTHAYDLPFYDFKSKQCKVVKLAIAITKTQLIAVLVIKQSLKFYRLAVIEKNLLRHETSLGTAVPRPVESLWVRGAFSYPWGFIIYGSTSLVHLTVTFYICQLEWRKLHNRCHIDIVRIHFVSHMTLVEWNKHSFLRNNFCSSQTTHTSD